ncbi:MAG: tetratricopeptide repeat protein [Candidatus Adiutrix sp.]|jgi:tetratricopeptide (TPR) repeat protein|nr:tetratricopeptide repeat protein [Candidatus Adiutrix sp.]
MVTIKVNIMPGVYSETKVQSIGTMSTARKQTVVDYYQCVQLDDKTMTVQILDMDGHTLPLKENIPLDEFLKRFTYEPEKFKEPKTPAQLTAEKHVAIAEKHVERKELNSAEYEYFKALKADQENVRANFGLGKVYLETGDLVKAAEIFSRLAHQDNIMAPENKHFFNDLGRELLSLQLYGQAIDFYEKARTMMGTDDENLLFNIARAAYESGDQAKASDFLDQALALNPELGPALKLKVALEKGEEAAPEGEA